MTQRPGPALGVARPDVGSGRPRSVVSERVRSIEPAGGEFVGRVGELERLREICRLAESYGAQVAVVSGEAGIGKTKLVAEFASQLEGDPWETHVGHCIEYAERPLPFGPIIGLLRSVLLGALDQIEHVIGARRADLALLIPELRDDDDTTSLAGDDDRLLDAICETVRVAAALRPLLLIIEDIHWADSATLDLVAMLSRNLADAPVAVIVTERTGTFAPSGDRGRWRAEQLRLRNAHHVVVSGFGRDDLRALSDLFLERTCSDEELDRLLLRSGGNAYFAYELLSGRDAHLSATLLDFVAGRLRTLDPELLEVLKGLAIAGGFAEHRLLAEVFPDYDLPTIVRECVERSVVDVVDRGYRFRHALMREVIEGELLPFEAESLHEKLAVALQSDLQRSTSPSALAEIAAHWRSASDIEQSAVASWHAATAAASVAAYGEAADLALHVVDAWSQLREPDHTLAVRREDVVLLAADWLHKSSRDGEAADLLEAALRGWARSAPEITRALLLSSLVQLAYELGRSDQLAPMLDEIDRLVGEDSSADAAWVHNRVAKHLSNQGFMSRCISPSKRAIEIAEQHGPIEVLIEAMTTHAFAIGVAGNRQRALELVEQARAMALRHDLVSLVADAMRRRHLIVNFHDGFSPECIALVEEGVDFVERRCGRYWRTILRTDLVNAYADVGRFRSAESVLANLGPGDVSEFRGMKIRLLAAGVALKMGRLDEGAAHLRHTGPIADRIESSGETGLHASVMAELRFLEGRHREALEWIDTALRWQLASDNITYTRESIVMKLRIVEALEALGGDEVESVVAECAELVEGFSGPGLVNLAFRELMQLKLLMIQGRAGPEDALRAVKAFDATNHQLEKAETHLMAAELLVRAPSADCREVHEHVRAAYDIGAPNGMARIVEACRSFAADSGLDLGVDAAEPHPLASDDRSSFSLTGRELEVLSLVAEGMTNKAIGESLFVSPRTVSTHVSNVLSKLGVSTRGEAGALYLRLGDDVAKVSD